MTRELRSAPSSTLNLLLLDSVKDRSGFYDFLDFSRSESSSLGLAFEI